ncbi:hypothetical protein DL764_001155 [Monosporascus ibericus]|uniref:Uncharacterized protein n=1 Tax=Monosporascus ibericus TaxID=155417 RepID=A0A4Q4TVM1_9PEZI|nr:hypothetical protein DL764_001155 [Monosporascus ibericus]
MKQLPVRTLICSGRPSGFGCLWSHLEAINEISFEKGSGSRAFGLSGYAASVDYILSHIANMTGAKALKQDFPVWFGVVESTSFKVDDEELYVYGITYSPFTSGGGLSSEIVLGPPDEECCYDANYDGLDVKDKIVLTRRYCCPTEGTLAGPSMGEVNLDAYAHRASSTAPVRLDPVKMTVILEVFKVLQNYRFKNKVPLRVVGSRVERPSGMPGYWGVSNNDGRVHGSVGSAGAEVIQNIYHELYESLGLEVTPAVLTNGNDSSLQKFRFKIISPRPASSSASAPPATPPQPSPPYETSTAGLQGRFWNQAYDELESSEPQIPKAYEKIVSAKLQDGASSPSLCSALFRLLFEVSIVMQ